MKNTKKIGSKRRGQGMTEYVILVGLVAVALVGAVTKFKTSLGNAFEASTKTSSRSETSGSACSAS